MTIDEGYIKFNCKWQEKPFESGIEIQQLIDFRNRVRKCGLIGVYDNGIGYGNVSQRYIDNSFYISGSATGTIDSATQNHFSLVNSYNVRQNHVHCEGPSKASSESMSHAAIYASLDWVQVVLHIHDMEFWETNKGILPSTIQEAAYGTPEMALSIKEVLSKPVNVDRRIIIMSGHEEGILLYGKDFDEVWNLLINFGLNLP
ncbi:MAG: class II aldolase/adducin family protein [Bacteroidota bacterium]